MEEYQVIQAIGRGAFGQALLVRRLVEPDAGELFVVKQINMAMMTEEAKEAARNEIRFIEALEHPNIIGYEHYFEQAGILNIVLEYADGGDLSKRIKDARDRGQHFPERLVLFWFAQIASALAYVHDRKILHRDLKSQNVFLTKDNIVKLGDFGIARVLSDTRSLAETVIGTPYYMSPELCENKPYNFKSDVWALGCVLYELLTLKHAFDGSNMCALVLKIISGKYPAISDRYSTELRDLVDAMLRSNPDDRPSVSEILATPLIQRVLPSLCRREMAVGEQRLKQGLLEGQVGLNVTDPDSMATPIPGPAPGLPESGTGAGAEITAGTSFPADSRRRTKSGVSRPGAPPPLPLALGGAPPTHPGVQRTLSESHVGLKPGHAPLLRSASEAIPTNTLESDVPTLVFSDNTPPTSSDEEDVGVDQAMVPPSLAVGADGMPELVFEPPSPASDAPSGGVDAPAAVPVLPPPPPPVRGREVPVGIGAPPNPRARRERSPGVRRPVTASNAAFARTGDPEALGAELQAAAVAANAVADASGSEDAAVLAALADDWSHAPRADASVAAAAAAHVPPRAPVLAEMDLTEATLARSNDVHPPVSRGTPKKPRAHREAAAAAAAAAQQALAAKPPPPPVTTTAAAAVEYLEHLTPKVPSSATGRLQQSAVSTPRTPIHLEAPSPRAHRRVPPPALPGGNRVGGAPRQPAVPLLAPPAGPALVAGHTTAGFDSEDDNHNDDSTSAGSGSDHENTQPAVAAGGHRLPAAAPPAVPLYASPPNPHHAAAEADDGILTDDDVNPAMSSPEHHDDIPEVVHTDSDAGSIHDGWSTDEADVAEVPEEDPTFAAGVAALADMVPVGGEEEVEEEEPSIRELTAPLLSSAVAAPAPPEPAPAPTNRTLLDSARRIRDALRRRPPPAAASSLAAAFGEWEAPKAAVGKRLSTTGTSFGSVEPEGWGELSGSDEDKGGPPAAATSRAAPGASRRSAPPVKPRAAWNTLGSASTAPRRAHASPPGRATAARTRKEVDAVARRVVRKAPVSKRMTAAQRRKEEDAERERLVEERMRATQQRKREFQAAHRQKKHEESARLKEHRAKHKAIVGKAESKIGDLIRERRRQASTSSPGDIPVEVVTPETRSMAATAPVPHEAPAPQGGRPRASSDRRPIRRRSRPKKDVPVEIFVGKPYRPLVPEGSAPPRRTAAPRLGDIAKEKRSSFSRSKKNMNLSVTHLEIANTLKGHMVESPPTDPEDRPIHPSPSARQRQEAEAAQAKVKRASRPAGMEELESLRAQCKRSLGDMTFGRLYAAMRAGDLDDDTLARETAGVNPAALAKLVLLLRKEDMASTPA